MAQAVYDEHPLQEYLRVEAGEEENHLVPGTHPAFNRVLFTEELPPFDLRWLAPLFERVSQTVREDNFRRRKSEEFAEVFKWRLVSSALLATTPVGGIGSSVMTARSTFTTNHNREEDASSLAQDGHSQSCLPGDLSALTESYYDAESTILTPDDEVLELPSVPLLSSAVLVLLRFPQVLLLVFALCTPFWSTFLVQGGLWRVFNAEQEVEGQNVEVAADYEETLSTLDSLISCCESWEQTTHHAITYLSSLQFVSYAYSPSSGHTDFPQMTDTAVPAVLSEILAQTLRTTGSHTSTIRSLLNALARSPREMRMLERMYAPVSLNYPSPINLRTVGTDELRRTQSSMSISTCPPLEEDERCSVDEDDMQRRLTPPPPAQRRGMMPLSLSPSSPSVSTTNLVIRSAPPSATHSPTQSLLSLSPPLFQHTRPQSSTLSRSPENGIGRFHSPLPSSNQSILSHSHSGHSHSHHFSTSSSSAGGQRSLPTSPNTKFTTLPSRIGSPSGTTGHPGRGRRRSLSSLRPWSTSTSDITSPSNHPPSSPSTRPASSPSTATVTLESTPTHGHSAPYASRLSTRDLEPLMITTSELTELKKDAKAEIRYTSACFLGLRFLSPLSNHSAHHKSQSYSIMDLWGRVESYLWPSKHSLHLASGEPKRKTSDESFLINEDGDEEDEDDALDADIAYDPAYWEDVRSVLGLFKTALEDGTEKIRDAFPDSAFPNSVPPESIPSSTPVTTPASALPTSQPLVEVTDVKSEIGQTNELLDFLKGGKTSLGHDSGFAPMASHLSRFVRHMESMQEALSDAQHALRDTVQFLTSISGSSTSLSPVRIQEQEAGYDRLRSALGVALRECERGRTPLLDHLHSNGSRFGLLGVGDTIPEEDSDHLRESMPLLIHDDQDEHERSSTESISIPMSSPPTTMRDAETLATIVEGHPPSVEQADQPTLQQLLEQAVLAIPEGREQIYEAETEKQSDFDRKRSTMSRDERIKQAKARRANGESVLEGERNGRKLKKSNRPGIDVVQELKDVIWQVNERRKRIGRSSLSTSRFP